MGKSQCEPGHTFGNEAGARGELHIAPRWLCCATAYDRAGEPGHAVALDVLSLPAEMLINAATGGSKLQLSRYFPQGSPSSAIYQHLPRGFSVP